MLFYVYINCLNAFNLFHTVEVAGSIPAPPTMNIKGVMVQAVPLFLFMAGCLKN